MKRTVFSLLAAFALCVSAAAVGPAVSCPSALLMEKQTGTVLFAQVFGWFMKPNPWIVSPSSWPQRGCPPLLYRT